MGKAMRWCVALLAVGLPACAHVDDGAALPGWRPLAEGVHFRAGTFEPGRQPDGNSLLLRGREGWIVVDTGRHPAHASAIVDAVRGSGRPLMAIVNTHWHLDHVSGNAPLREAYPSVAVHAAARIETEMETGGFLAGYRRQLDELLRTRPDDPQAGGWRAEIARIDTGPALFPTHPVVAREQRDIDGRALELGFVTDAASGGDVWVFDRATRTLAAGDLVTLPVPFLDTACPEGWNRALAALSALPFARVVPGHGAPMSRDRFERYRHAFGALLACAAGGEAGAVCADGWVADLGDLLSEDEARRARGMLVEYYLPAKLRGKAPAPEYCGG